MSTRKFQAGFTTIDNLPKIDLHRHLEGSLRLETLYEIALEYDLGLSITKPIHAAALAERELVWQSSNVLLMPIMGKFGSKVN